MIPVIVEERINAPVESIWNAITDLETMKLWYFENIDQFKLEIGTKFKFEVNTGEWTFTHLWEVTEVLPLKLIAYNRRYVEYSGDSVVTFQLWDESGVTKLRLTAKFINDFPAEIPEFKRESCEAGWRYFIQQRLKNFLELNR